MSMASGILYTPPNYHKSHRILIAAQFSKACITVKEYSEELARSGRFPVDAVPLFECPDNGLVLFEPNAIAYYVGTEQLRGGSDASTAALVTQWVNYTDAVFLPAMASVVYPSLGATQLNKAECEKAKTQLGEVFTKLNNHLASRTFLVGERLTQADITLLCTVRPLLETHYETGYFRTLYPHVHRWALTMGNQSQVVAATGAPIRMCDRPLPPFDPKKYAELHPKTGQQGDSKEHSHKQAGGKKKGGGKGEEKPAAKVQEQKKKKEKQEKEQDEEIKEEVYKDHFADMPRGEFDMDEFKRTYSNKDIATVAVPYFWEHFEPAHYSIWTCTYNFPDQLSRTFMSSNLIGGMFQRLDRLRKYAFGSMIVFGDNTKSTIEGLWFWRGNELAFSYHDSLSIDSESYTWTKREPDNEETRNLVRRFFLQEHGGWEELDRKYATGKIFK